MMEMKYFYFYSNSSLGHCYLQIPKLCPICGVSNNPEVSLKFSAHINGVESYGFCLKCSCCNKSSFVLNSKNQGSYDHFGLLTAFPSIQMVEFDDTLVELSPIFVKLYSQAYHCEQNNYIEIAGMGYRSALEILIKDYALHFELDTKEDITKLNLNRAIEKYFKTDTTAFVAADVVRIIGNDYTHWEQNEEYSLDVLKAYFELVINIIKTKFMIESPPVRRHR